MFCAKLYKIGVFLTSNRSWLGWAKKSLPTQSLKQTTCPPTLLRDFCKVCTDSTYPARTSPPTHRSQNENRSDTLTSGCYVGRGCGVRRESKSSEMVAWHTSLGSELVPLRTSG